MSKESPTLERGDEIEDLSMEELRERYQELKLENERLKELATKDPLTGAYNRRGFEEAVSKLFPKRQEVKEEKRAESSEKGNAILILDIDNFKIVNDTYGHSEGDQLLKAVVSYLRQIVRPEDIITRYGGEEFVILFRNADAQDIINKFYDSGRAGLRVGVTIAGEQMNITFSGGVVDWTPADDLDSTIDAADKMLYEAKASGKDRIQKIEIERKK